LSNKNINKDKRPATKEQLKEIDSNIKRLGLGESLEDFTQKFSDEDYRKNFSTTLAKQMRDMQGIPDGFASSGMIQPKMSEDLYQKINVDPHVATSAQIDSMLEEPQKHSRELRGVSQYLNYSVGQYHRSLWYFNTIKSFNYTLNPTDIDNIDVVSGKDYQHAYETCLLTLRKLNVKYQYSKIDLQVLVDGVGFYWLSETKDSISFLQLPSDWCYITSPWTYGFKFTFDLTYFDQYSGLESAIPELYNAYKHFTKMRDNTRISRKEVEYLQYYPVPVESSWVFTFDPVHPDKVPPLSSAMGSALDVISYKKLLLNMLALDLFKIISLKIPLKKDGSNMAITYNQASEITSVIQSSLPDNIIAYSSPFESDSMSIDQTDRFSDIVGISNDSFFSNVGVSNGNFGSNGLNQGTALAFSSSVDFAYASTHMYFQFANCTNWILSQKTKKYKFTTTFFGNKLNEQAETKSYASLVTTANMPVMKLFAYSGYEPFEVISTLRLESALGVKDLMKPLISAFQKSAKDSDNESQDNKNKVNDGRPQEADVGEAGEQARDYKDLQDTDIG